MDEPNRNETHPFVYGRPVRPNEFFNRESSLQTVFNRLRKEESTAIVGEPHIGKSSLLLKLEDKDTQKDYLGDDSLDLIISSIDLHPVGSEYSISDFWMDALYDLDEYPGDENIARYLDRLAKRNYHRRDLEKLFNYMGNGGRKLVLLLDEFDKLLFHPNFKENPSFFALLRSLATRTGGLVIIPASRLSIADMNSNSRDFLERVYSGSPYFNNFIEEKLSPFDENTVSALLYQAKVDFTQEDVSLIDQIAGKNPFLIQAMAASLAEEQPGPDRLKKAVTRFYKRISFHFDDLWNILDDRARSAAVLLSMLESSGRSLGKDFADNQFDFDRDNLSPEFLRLSEMGLARQLKNDKSDDWLSPVTIFGERWTIGARAFAWWIYEVLITGQKQVYMVEEWLLNERYRLFMQPEQWQWLMKAVKTANRVNPIKPESLHLKSIELREILQKYFNTNELVELCFKLEINYEDLAGDTHSAKVVSLIEYGKRRNILDRILNECIDLRPNIVNLGQEE